MKNKHYRVSGRFYIDINRFITAKTESEAIRKVRDSSIKNRRIKKSNWAKNEANVIELD